MKITKSQLQELTREAFQNGFFEEVTEEMLNDDNEMNHLLKVFLSELRFKKVIRKKKIFKRVVCPKNKKYKASKKGKGKCVIKSAGEKVRKRTAMKRGAMKKRGKMAKIIRKRKKSMKVRKRMGWR
jgi:hypothetical protein